MGENNVNIKLQVLKEKNGDGTFKDLWVILKNDHISIKTVVYI